MMNIDDNITFESCKFERIKIAEDVVRPILKKFPWPINLTVNGPYGYGKTTFLKMLKNFLQEEYEVIYFNAWETDFVADPFLAIYSEIAHEDDNDKKLLLSIVKSTVFGSAKILTNLLPPIINGIANDGITAIQKLIDTEITKEINEYKNMKKNLKEFRQYLSKKIGSKRKVVFIIDELDRCKPLYAIALLERIKHIFNIENITYIFGIDKKQLSHSVRTLYGEGMDSDGYLRRFFDIELSLPKPEFSVLLECEKLCDNKEFDEFLKHDDFRKYYADLLTTLDFSVRDFEKLVFRLKLVDYKQYRRAYDVRDTVAIRLFLTVLKMKKENFYYKIKDRKTNAQTVFDNILVETRTQMGAEIRKSIQFFIKGYLDYRFTDLNRSPQAAAIKHPNYDNYSLEKPEDRRELHNTMETIFKAIEYEDKIKLEKAI